MPVPVTVNHCYGAKPPKGQRELAEEYLKRNHAFRCALAAEELLRRKEYNELLYKHAPELRELAEPRDKLQKVIDEKVAEILLRRQLARKKIQLPELEKEIKALKKQIKPLNAAFQARKREFAASDVMREEQKELDFNHKMRLSGLRKSSQINWCNYQLIELACQSFQSGPPPRDTTPYLGEGRLAVHIQDKKPLLWQDLVSGLRHPWLRIDPPEQDYRPNWHRVSINLGSVKDPVWLTAHARLHRNDPRVKACHRIPPGTEVSWVVLHKRRVAGREVWILQITLGNPSGMREGNPTAYGEIGVDLGFRKLDAGVRVAYWQDEAGRHGDLQIPLARWYHLDKAEHIRSIRQELQNAVLACLLDFQKQPGEKPAWWDERTKGLAGWKKARRFANLARTFREQLQQDRRREVPGYPARDLSTEQLQAGWHFSSKDLLAVEKLLTAWQRRDLHLWKYEQGIRDGFVNWRRNFYRQWAFEMAQKYDLIRLEDINLQKLIAVPPVEQLDEMSSTKRNWQARAALGELRGYLIQRANRSSLVNPANTTQSCHGCNHIDNFDAATELRHVCSNCGLTWDQDHNAAINILQGIPIPPKEKKPSRQDRVAAKPKKTKEEKQAARLAKRAKRAAWHKARQEAEASRERPSDAA